LLLLLLLGLQGGNVPHALHLPLELLLLLLLFVSV
jgi:hypothetical protein